MAYPGFDYLDIVPVTGTMAIRDSQALLDLFRMTPYAWKTPRAGVERLGRPGAAGCEHGLPHPRVCPAVPAEPLPF